MQVQTLDLDGGVNIKFETVQIKAQGERKFSFFLHLHLNIDICRVNTAKAVTSKIHNQAGSILIGIK